MQFPVKTKVKHTITPVEKQHRRLHT